MLHTDPTLPLTDLPGGNAAPWPLRYADEVDAGAAFLDSWRPGWDEAIDLAELDLRLPCCCTLGQLAGGAASGYYTACRELGLDPYGQRCRELGFTVHLTPDGVAGSLADYAEYGMLTDAWRAEIERRRTLDV